MSCRAPSAFTAEDVEKHIPSKKQREAFSTHGIIRNPTVNQIGRNTISEITAGLNRCQELHKDATYAFLPLGDKASPLLVEQCEKLGLSFAGIMPHIHNGDNRVLLQKVNTHLDPTKIRLHGENSTKLFAYIWEEKQRVSRI